VSGVVSHSLGSPAWTTPFIARYATHSRQKLIVAKIANGNIFGAILRFCRLRKEEITGFLSSTVVWWDMNYSKTS
jgi:hypothetical protein